MLLCHKRSSQGDLGTWGKGPGSCLLCAAVSELSPVVCSQMWMLSALSEHDCRSAGAKVQLGGVVLDGT